MDNNDQRVKKIKKSHLLSVLITVLGHLLKLNLKMLSKNQDIVPVKPATSAAIGCVMCATSRAAK